MNIQKQNNKFLIISSYRVVMFVGLCGFVLFASVFGSVMWRYYIGTGNTFNYQGGTLAVHFLDVGQGDASVIQFPDGRVAIIDCGTDWYYTRVKTYLKTRILKDDNNKIDFLIATHSHDDHVGGFAQLLADFDVDIVYRPHNKSLSGFDTGELAGGMLVGEARGVLADTAPYTSFIDAAYTYANQVLFVEAGIEINNTDIPYSLYFHTPTLDYINVLENNFTDFNEISPIISLSFKNHVFIFTGDAGEKSEIKFRDSPRALAMASAGVFQNSQVYLKLGHHGSNGSTTIKFLEFIKPNKAIACAGARNLYGFPHQKVIERLESVGLTSEDILKTGDIGNIVFATDGATDRMYFAYDNEADLSLLYVISAVLIFALCFVNYRTKN